jgi:hypothetical protein
VVETLDGLTFKSKGTRKAAEIWSRLENGNVVAGLDKVVGGGQSRQATSNHNDTVS